MVRNCVKWDHNIGPDDDIHEVLQHAIDVAFSEPRGPVYLSYARQALSGMVEKRGPESITSSVTRLPAANPEQLGKIATHFVKK